MGCSVEVLTCTRESMSAGLAPTIFTLAVALLLKQRHCLSTAVFDFTTEAQQLGYSPEQLNVIL